MIKNAFLSALLFIVPGFHVFADIAPNPIKAKGIVAIENTTIRMVSERVVVDLYKDSSVVECLFYMKNEGEKQSVNIGFPEMNFHHFKTTNIPDYKTANFKVHENEIEVQLIDVYTPNENSFKEQKSFEWKSNFGYHEQPWFLWDSDFDACETKIIKVSYRLPFGAVKRGYRFFTYLLNTGTGWQGRIDTAEVIVNLKDISNDLIIDASPENHIVEENKISWKFTNLEPKLSDNIKIRYEVAKGSYEKMKTENPEPTIIFNGKILSSKETLNISSLFDSIPKEEILSIKVLKELKDTKKYTSSTGGVVLIYSKGYAVEKLEKLMALKVKGNPKSIYSSTSDFIEKHELFVNQAYYSDNEMLIKAIEIEKEDIKSVKITNQIEGKKTIELILKK